MGASAIYHQPSFYPSGWPTGSITITISGDSVIRDFDLVSSQMEWTPGALDVTLDAGDQQVETLLITNTGTGPLYYNINLVDGLLPEPPAGNGEAGIPDLPRVDPQIATDIAANGAADFVVVLNGQADLTDAAVITDWAARGRYVYNTLSSFAEHSQARLRKDLSSRAVDYTPLYIINAVIVHNGDMALVNDLAIRSDVAQIVANRRIEIEDVSSSALATLLASPYGPVAPEAVGWNIAKVNADDVWSVYNVRGEGVVVAEIDSGTQWDHPALRDHYRGWNGSTADHNYNWYDPYGQYPNVPFDPGAHGTHVMGTMIGDDPSHTNQIGMAPGAQWISCKGGDAVSGYLLTNELLICAQWILAPTDLNGNNPDPNMRPHVVNNSWGGGQGDYWYTGAISAWRAAGIFPTFSNGNSGPSCSTAGSPGDNWESFSSGATDLNDLIGDFSSRGPAAYTGILKPDISSPGVNVRSSVPNNTYANYNGTSMASPHTAGAVVLLWSASPELIGQVDLTGWVLQQTALQIVDTTCGGTIPNNVYGYGRLDIKAAVDLAIAGGVTPDWLAADPMYGEVAPGESVAVEVTFSPSYDMLGIYTATLWIVADDPNNTDVRIPITLDVVPVAPTPEFSSNSPVPLGTPMIFTNVTVGSEPIDYLWSFGDGVTSTLESPTHTYATIGEYTVILTATNSEGSASVSHDVLVYSGPLPEFTSNSPVMLGEPMVFTNTTTGTEPIDYLWSFGDGVTSTLESPTHTYATSGEFTVVLTATNAGGSYAVSHDVLVIEPLSADFTYEPMTVTTGVTVTFTSLVTGTEPFTYLWDFDDGVTSTVANPTHIFETAGVYTVTLTVTDMYGEVTVEHIIVVEAAGYEIYLPVITKQLTHE